MINTACMGGGMPHGCGCLSNISNLMKRNPSPIQGNLLSLSPLSLSPLNSPPSLLLRATSSASPP